MVMEMEYTDIEYTGDGFCTVLVHEDGRRQILDCTRREPIEG